MAPDTPILRRKMFVMWLLLGLYLFGRLCQLWADTLPSMLIVLLHVLPPTVFAILHGGILYGRKGMSIFTVCCLGISGFFELLSLQTGFPFGHYYFTGVMGPKLVGLPFLLVLAYLGIGYCCWVLAMLILGYSEIGHSEIGYRDRRLSGQRAVGVPVLAAFLMLSWDLAMDPAWATVDRAWIWRDGGAFYGVPVSNFFGRYLTAYLFFQAFALWHSTSPLPTSPSSSNFWRTPILFYLLCAVGNLLLLRLPHVPTKAIDPSGRVWVTAEIFAVCAMISLLLMVPMALLAWLRVAGARAAKP